MNPACAPACRRACSARAIGWTPPTTPRPPSNWPDQNLYNLVISDVKMPGMSGLELLAQIRERHRDTLFILMTAFSTVENAVAAMRLGAYDYLPKPIDLKRLRVLVQKALEHQAVVVENHELRLAPGKTFRARRLLIGESEPMRAVDPAD